MASPLRKWRTLISNTIVCTSLSYTYLCLFNTSTCNLSKNFVAYLYGYHAYSSVSESTFTSYFDMFSACKCGQVVCKITNETFEKDTKTRKCATANRFKPCKINAHADAQKHKALSKSIILTYEISILQQEYVFNCSRFYNSIISVLGRLNPVTSK